MSKNSLTILLLLLVFICSVFTKIQFKENSNLETIH